MGYMRKLPEPGAPCHDLLLALHELHLRAGEPSTRAIESSSGHAISRETANRVLRGGAVPRWNSLAAVVVALGGDVEIFRELWISARRAEGQRGG